VSKAADNLRNTVLRAICDAEWGTGHHASGALSLSEKKTYAAMADAAIAAYRAHPDGAAKDWLAGRDAAVQTVKTARNVRLTREDLVADIFALRPPTP
jgi:hypothetical protein